jgi:hypothetical protein
MKINTQVSPIDFVRMLDWANLDGQVHDLVQIDHHEDGRFLRFMWEVGGRGCPTSIVLVLDVDTEKWHVEHQANIDIDIDIDSEVAS